MNIAFEIPSENTFSSDESRWQAVVERDPHADGAFFFAVRTTGVFCRPSCASRAPRRENVEFFPTTNAAETAGYRPCKRCQPTSLPRELAIVERACKALDADPQQRLTLAQLSDAVHVSPFHLQRLFTRVVGVSPRQYQAARRAEALRDALQRGQNVTRATHRRRLRLAVAHVRSGIGRTGHDAVGVSAQGRRAYRALRHRRHAARHRARRRDRQGHLQDRVRRRSASARGRTGGGVVAGGAHRGSRARCSRSSRRSRVSAKARASTSTCRSTSARPRSSSACGMRCDVFRTARRAAIPTSPTRSARRAPCGRWRTRARRIRWRSRFRVIGSCIRAAALAGYRWGTPRKAALLKAERAHDAAGPRGTADVDEVA